MLRKIKKVIIIIFCVLIVVSNLGMEVFADGSNRRNNIQSRGTIKFGNGEVFVTSQDLYNLADEIDILENTYKSKLVDALNDIGTYFKQDGVITYDRSQNEVDDETEKSSLPFSIIKQGILTSQSIPNTYQAAVANNISSGCAAWVNGQLIIGNGKDNQDNWQNGYKEGYSQGIADSLGKMEVRYTYHRHIGDSTQVEGCYGILTGIKPVLCGCTQYAHTDILGHSTCANCWHNHGVNKCGATISNQTYEYIGLVCGKTEETIESATIIY